MGVYCGASCTCTLMIDRVFLFARVLCAACCGKIEQATVGRDVDCPCGGALAEAAESARAADPASVSTARRPRPPALPALHLPRHHRCFYPTTTRTTSTHEHRRTALPRRAQGVLRLRAPVRRRDRHPRGPAAAPRRAHGRRVRARPLPSSLLHSASTQTFVLSPVLARSLLVVRHIALSPSRLAGLPRIAASATHRGPA